MSVLRNALIATTGAVMFSACTAGAGGEHNGDTITLRYAFFAPIESFPGLQMEEWKEELEKRTDGKVNVELYPGATLLDSGDIYDGVSAGAVDVGLDTPSYDASRFPMSSVINTPIDVEDAQTGSRVFLDLLTEFEPDEFSDYEIITAFTTEPSYFQTVDPIAKVADAKGQELRSSSAVTPILDRFGAAPVGMPVPEVPQALQTGVISGYVSSRDVLEDFGLAEQVSYVTDYPLGVASGFVAVMDKERYAQLPDDVQEVIENLRPEMMEFASKFHDNENITSAMKFAESNDVETVEVDPDEVPTWDQIMNESTDEWVSEHEGVDFDSAEVMERARELVDEYRTSR